MNVLSASGAILNVEHPFEDAPISLRIRVASMVAYASVVCEPSREAGPLRDASSDALHFSYFTSVSQIFNLGKA